MQQIANIYDYNENSPKVIKRIRAKQYHLVLSDYKIFQINVRNKKIESTAKLFKHLRFAVFGKLDCQFLSYHAWYKQYKA